MQNLRSFALLLCSLFSLALMGQCKTVTEIRSDLGDSTLIINSYIERLHAACPTAADSLAPALYSRALFYNGLARTHEAIAYGKLTLRELNQTDTVLALGKMTYNMGFFHNRIGDRREAIRYFREATEIFPRIDHPESNLRLNYARADLGYAYGAIGDYQRAEEVLRALAGDAARREDRLGVAYANQQLGEQYLERGLLAAAAGALEVAIAGFLAEDVPDALAATRVSRVGLLRKQGKAEAALAEVEELLDFPGLEEDDRARLLSIGVLLAVDEGDGEKAERFFRDNLAVVSGGDYPDPSYVAQAWDNGGEAAMAHKDYKQAADRFDQALGTLIPGYVPNPEAPVPTEAQLSASPYKVDVLIYLGDLARAFAAQGRSDEALAALRSADRVADQLRAGLGGELSALFWRERALPLYEKAINICFHLGRPPEEAFYFFEKSRAILLLEALAENDLRGRLPRPAARRLAAAERQLRRAQTGLLEQAEDEEGKDDYPDLPTARQELLDLRAALADSFPAAFPDANPEVIDLEQALANLRQGGFARQLQYFVGEDNVYLLSLDAERNGGLHLLGPTDSVLAAVRPLLAYFTDAGAIDQDPQGYDRAATLAHTTLIAPAAPPQDAALLIVPDGLLSYVPFAALRADGRYLIERNPVAYAQSATLFGRASAPVSTAALAFTPFAEAGTGQAAALPHTAAEAAALNARYPTTRLTGPAATRAVFTDSLPYGILHLGTHAQANRTAASAPRILTATEPLFVPDIYGLDLHGALVTLSACHSNVGPLARGEGVLGLGRAFRAAGAGGVVASLWALNDRATADITGGFYAALAAGQTKPMALHAAQLNYLQREDLPSYLKSPYYWAGLTYYGDAGTLKRGTMLWWWIAGAVVAFGLLGGFIYGRRSN